MGYIYNPASGDLLGRRPRNIFDLQAATGILDNSIREDGGPRPPKSFAIDTDINHGKLQNHTLLAGRAFFSLGICITEREDSEKSNRRIFI